jgi:hypothetical protein
MEAVYHAGEGRIEISRPSRFLSFFRKVDMDPSPVYGPYALVTEAIGPGEIHVFTAADAVSAHGEKKLEYVFKKRTDGGIPGKVIHVTSFHSHTS